MSSSGSFGVSESNGGIEGEIRKAGLDWAEMEGLFCQQAPSVIPATKYSLSPNNGTETEPLRKSRESTEVSYRIK